MPKGQQRGNKEAKKPKKAPAAPMALPATPVPGGPTQNTGSDRRPKK